ncbi:hypothetical protein [Methylobacterium sp. 37f]|nr:hypothetical protein [Methylobacterium sp. 37f]MCK2056806.1 hypothetical protein [Methylobacterium sp. 37f]
MNHATPRHATDFFNTLLGHRTEVDHERFAALAADAAFDAFHGTPKAVAA